VTNTIAVRHATARVLSLVVLALDGDEELFEALAQHELEGLSEDEQREACLSIAWRAGRPISTHDQHTQRSFRALACDYGDSVRSKPSPQT
jgi:hypothetical protein